MYFLLSLWYDNKKYLSISNWDGRSPSILCDQNTENIIKYLYNPIENKEYIINNYIYGDNLVIDE